MVAVILIVRLVFAVITACIASHKGRNVVGWFFIGLFTELIGLIIILCLSNRKVEEARLQAADTERRRLREQIRQERLKSEAYRQHVGQRLDTHDRVLDVDTRSTQPLLGGTMESLPGGSPEEALTRMAQGGDPIAAAAAAAARSDGAQWYYELSGQTVGPVAELILRQMIAARRIPANSLVWTEGFGQWAPADQVTQFRDVEPS